VTFTNSSTIKFGTIHTYLWNFGDNSTSNAVSPGKTYLNEGSYSISLISVSERGCGDTLSALVNVNEAPVAVFSASDQCVNQRTYFSNSSFLTQGSFNSQWKFGDGGSGMQDSPEHQYRT